MRAPREKDREDFIRLVTSPEARAYLGGAIGHANRHGLELSPLGLTWGQWAIADASDTFLGLIVLSDDRGEMELAFALLPEHVGHGYSLEACRAVIEFVREHLPQAPCLIAVTPSNNKGSVAILKKLGFTVRRGFEEFQTQQFLMELPLR